MSEKINITGNLLKGINEFEKKLEPKLKEENIKIVEWGFAWSKEKNTSEIVIRAKKENKLIDPLVIYELEELKDFPNSNEEDKNRFLEEVLRKLKEGVIA